MNLQQVGFVLFLVVACFLASRDEARCEIPRGSFADVKRLGPTVSAEGMGEAAVDTLQTVSADGLTIYFTSFRDGGYGGADLWQAKRSSISEPFGPAMNLGPEINTADFENFPNISSDGRTLYFASTRAAGQGGFDLYQATRPTIDDSFGNVMNLGPGVNTSFVERGPNISNNGLMLYFTSNRTDTEGGDDIYMATRSDVSEPFENPINLGPGINSPTDEFVPSVASDGLTMFFSDFVRSPFRPGGKGDSDIWVAVRDAINAPFGDVVNLNDFSLNSNVNTVFRENAPFISQDWPASGSKLYFSSQPDGNVDIWQATWFPEKQGDFDGYGELDSDDINRLLQGIANETNDVRLDLTNDNLVNDADLATWIRKLRKTWFGDANLDGVFDSTDFVQVFQTDEYEDGIDANSTWETGDWNGDLEFDSGDFVMAFQDGGYENGPRNALNAVPEPSSSMLLLLGLFGCAASRRNFRQVNLVDDPFPK
ncbi:MAG: PD40 domain-containing protein [Planctomycetales bacterium]|nr:PD40 domain-containing protein [Planctomycetales bacterium]